MKSRRNIIICIIYLVLGITLVGLGCFEITDPFWSGMGGALVAVGLIRIIQICRFTKDDKYREKVETERGDERNRFIRNKAWAWAGYIFIIIAGISVIALKVAHQDLLSIAASGAVCLMIVLYWISYFILRKKY